MRADLWIRRVAVLTAAAGLLAVVATAVVAASPSARHALGITGVAPSFVPGAVLDLPPAARGSARQTLVIIADATCGVCERGKGVLADLVGRVRALPATGVALVTGSDWPESQGQYAREVGLDTAWTTADLRRMKVRQVPTIVLIDQQGVVIQSWDGLPSDVSAIINGVTSHSMTR